MRIIFSIVLLLLSLQAIGREAIFIKDKTVSEAVEKLVLLHGEDDRTLRGVQAVAGQWKSENGNKEEFLEFIEKHYVSDPTKIYDLALFVSDKLRQISGHIWKIGAELSYPFNVDTGDISPAEELFGEFNVGVNLDDSYYKNKIAFLVLLNFPPYTKEEKDKNGDDWTLTEWGYALLGDMFKEKEDQPEKSKKKRKRKSSMDIFEGNSQWYANNSVVLLKSIRGENNEILFGEDRPLLFHWKMRDEIKNLYGSSNPKKLEQQKAIYSSMKRYIDQSIPKQIMEEAGYEWNPYTNELKRNDSIIAVESVEDIRYAYIRNLYIKKSQTEPDSLKYFDKYFDSYGLKARDIEEMFVQVLSSKEAKEVGMLIKSKLGRDLEPFDVWYTGFNNRSNFDSEVLDNMMKEMFPTPLALEKAIPSILVRLGYPSDIASYYGSKITVEAARANGHAQGSTLKNDKSCLRTNFLETGLDFGGFQTAMHELGHVVQQTISTHKIDVFPRRRLPNSGVVESAAFLFEFRTWMGLPDVDSTDELYYNNILDNLWCTFEIVGPALCELRIWQWMYHQKTFSAQELKNAALSISKDIWNSYYAPIFGSKDQTMQATYNHMLNSSLYISSYALAHIIHMQIEEYIEGKDFANEVERIYGLGNLPPDLWMKRAVGREISAEPILKVTAEVLDKMEKLERN